MKTKFTLLSLWFALISFGVNAQTNDPTIDPIGDQSITEDDTEQTIKLTGITDGDDGTQKLTLEVSSERAGFFSTLEFNYDTDTSLVYQVAADSCGTAVVKVVVSDDTGASASVTFSVDVDCVNDPPTIDQVDDIVLDHNPGTYVVKLTGLTAGPPNEPSLSVVELNYDNSKIDNAKVTNYNSTTKEADLTIDFFTDASGPAFVKVKPIDDKGAFVEMTFYITIDTPTSLKDLQKDELALYPNPVSEVLNVTLPGVSESSVYEIYSMGGSLVLSGNGEGSVMQIAVGSLTRGWYQIKIVSDGKIYTGRFLVK